MKTLAKSLLRITTINKPFNIKYLIKNNNSYVNFSTYKSDQNPNQIPEQLKRKIQSEKVKKKVQQLPILKDISNIKNMDQLPQIFKKMVFMSKQNRQISLRYLLSAIYQHKLPIQAIYYKSLQVALKQYPHLKLETEIYYINYLIHQIQKIKRQLEDANLKIEDQQQKEKNILQLYNKINDKYYFSFNMTLKAIPQEHSARSKATLYKHFAQYNFEHLFNPKITDKNSSLFDQNIGTLKKAREFIAQSLKCHKQVLLNEHKKLQSDQIKNLKQQDSQRHLIRLNAIKQNIRKLVQSMGQCLYAIFKILNKQNRILKDSIQHKNRKIELLSYIDCYISFYSIIPGNMFNKYKRYKITINDVLQTAKFTSIGQPKNQQQVKAKIKQTVQEYNRLYKECQDCLDQSIQLNNFNHIKQISTTIISIKYMIGRTVKKSQIQIKNSIAQEAKIIIDKTKKQWKQPLQYYLMQIIKQMLNLKS